MLQIVERIGPHRPALSARYDEAHRTVERRHLFLHHGARQLFRHAQSQHGHQAPVVLLHVVIHWHRTVANLDGPRHRARFSRLLVAHEVPPIDQHRHVPDRLPARGCTHLRFIPRGELRLSKTRRDPAKTTPHFADLLDHRLIATHAGMSQFIAGGRLGERMTRRRRMLGRKLVEPLTFAREFKAEVREAATQQHRRLLPIRIDHQLG